MSDDESKEPNENSLNSPSKAKKGFMSFKKEPAAGGGLPSMPTEIIRKYQRGVEFRGKLIGSDTVPSAKGDNMCHTALAKLKAAVQVAKQHKPRIIIKVTEKELRLLDQDTRTDLHIHKLYKISYIVSDPRDNRAFGYIYGEKDGPWTFFGIKTEGQAIATILAIKELFEALASQRDEDDEVAAKKDVNELGAEKSDKKDEVEKAETKAAEPAKPAESEAKPVEIKPPSDSADTFKKKQSVEDMLLAIDDAAAPPAPELQPRASTDLFASQFAEAEKAPAPEQPKSVQDVLSDLFSPTALTTPAAVPNAATPTQPNPFGQPQGYFPPAQAPFANPYAQFGAFPPQPQPFYGQPVYGNVPGYGFGAPAMPAYGMAPPQPQRYPAPGFGAPSGFASFQTAAGDNSADSTALLTPRTMSSAPSRPAPVRPQAPSSDSWSFAGTGITPRPASGLFGEFVAGELDPNNGNQQQQSGNYVTMGELANNQQQ